VVSKIPVVISPWLTRNFENCDQFWLLELDYVLRPNDRGSWKSRFVAQSYCCFGSWTKTIIHRFIVNRIDITKSVLPVFLATLVGYSHCHWRLVCLKFMIPHYNDFWGAWACTIAMVWMHAFIFWHNCHLHPTFLSTPTLHLLIKCIHKFRVYIFGHDHNLIWSCMM